MELEIGLCEYLIKANEGKYFLSVRDSNLLLTVNVWISKHINQTQYWSGNNNVTDVILYLVHIIKLFLMILVSLHKNSESETQN